MHERLLLGWAVLADQVPIKGLGHKTFCSTAVGAENGRRVMFVQIPR